MFLNFVRGEGMKKFKNFNGLKKITIIKKKEAALIVIAILLMAIGFFSYRTDSNFDKVADIQNYPETALGEATLVNGNTIENSESDNSINKETTEENESIETSATVEETDEITKQDNYFTEAKMERNNTYSETLEIYENILENSNISSDQRVIAQNEITNITNEKKSIQVAENLIKLKGFEDVLILKNLEGINVIVKADVLLPEQVAQIQNIVEREFNIESKNINITNK